MPILSFTFDEEEPEEPAPNAEEAGQTADASEETAEPAEAAEVVWDFILRILSSQNRVVPHLLPMNLMELQLK